MVSKTQSFKFILLLPVCQPIHSKCQEASKDGYPDTQNIRLFPRTHYWCSYRAICAFPGLSVRDTLHASKASFAWWDLAHFLHSIHRKGVYFRSIHLGNIIHLGHSKFGLIDFTDVTFYRSPISLKRRAHNIHFIYKYQEDRHKMERTPRPLIKESYLEQALWNDEKIKRFEHLFERYQSSKGYEPQN